MAVIDTEEKLKRIKDNLKEHPHYELVWNQTADAYEKKVEKIESLLKIRDMGIESEDLNRKISEFLHMCRKSEFQIAFVGTIKTGKSTLINALLGHNYASADVTPETAALTKFRSSDRDYVHVTFYSEKEWQKLWKSVQAGADKFLEEYKELHADREKKKWVGRQEKHIEVANSEIEEELSKWTSSKSAIHYFVKEVEVGISTLPKEFPKEVVFVDTPGLSDPVEYRSQISRDYIHKANAVFVCVDATKMHREEIETIASVFSFSAHNKNKVHVIATHWDSLNDPVEDWKKQKEYMSRQLTGKGFYESKEMAVKNIMYSAAYIYNLCRDYENLDKGGRKSVHILPMKLDMDVEIGMLTQSDLSQIMEVTNIREIHKVIVEELIQNYAELLFGDIENSYRDILHMTNRIAGERKKEIDERLRLLNADMQEIEKAIEDKKRAYKEIGEARKQLVGILELLKKIERAD